MAYRNCQLAQLLWRILGRLLAGCRACFICKAERNLSYIPIIGDAAAMSRVCYQLRKCSALQ